MIIKEEVNMIAHLGHFFLVRIVADTGLLLTQGRKSMNCSEGSIGQTYVNRGLECIVE